MIVGFDTWILSSRYRCHGYYVYAKRLLEELGRLLHGSNSIHVRPFVFPGAANDANELAGSRGIEPAVTKLVNLKPQYWWGAGAQFASWGIKADLHFSPTLRILPLGLVPTVSMIADTTPLKLPELLLRRGFSDRVFLNLSSRFSAGIITISECSKRDIIDAYNVRPEKVSVTYLGFEKELFNTDPVSTDDQQALFKRLGIRKPYILHHGSLHIRKNLVRLVQSYSLLMDRHPGWDSQLVLVGTFGWQHEQILEAARDVRGRGKVVVTGPLPDEELAIVVKGASAVVVPSLYEGFCLPMVEAMACGIPTITSNTSCLPEISGNVLRYFNPLSVEAIADSIEAVLCDAQLRQELSSAGIKRAAEFSWEKCARETLASLVNTHQEISGRILPIPQHLFGEGTVTNGQTVES